MTLRCAVAIRTASNGSIQPTLGGTVTQCKLTYTKRVDAGPAGVNLRKSTYTSGLKCLGLTSTASPEETKMSAANATAITITATDDDEQPQWRREEAAADRCAKFSDDWFYYSKLQGVSAEVRDALWVVYVHAVAEHERITAERGAVSIVEWSANPWAYRYGVRRQKYAHLRLLSGDEGAFAQSSEET